VIAGNSFLADYAARFNHNVTVVPSSVDVAAYPRSVNSNVIGWIGSRTTLPYLSPLKPVFETLDVKPRVIGSGDPTQLGFETEFRPWLPETEIKELSQFGVGIAPLPDTPWEHGKCGVKILQYMACGIPVVASPVGVNAQLVVNGVNGFLAKNTEEWTTALRTMIADSNQRQQFGAAGRTEVEKHYTVQAAAAAVNSVLRSLV
jgi:glycosyltransferase involved in cell wall biosynthesis